MSKFTAPSGASVEIQLSDYSTSWDLFNAILRAAKEGGIAKKLPKNFNANTADIMSMELSDLGGLFDIVMDIITSREVTDLIFKCLEKGTYNDSRINRDTFEKEEARGDFLTIAWEVGKLNIIPFTKNLSSLLKAVMA